jgi:hypothetical protein
MSFTTLPGSSPLLNPRTNCPRPGYLESISHYLQLLDLTHSRTNIFAWILKPVNRLIAVYQSFWCNSGAYLYRKCLVHGPNFVCAGGVWLSEFDTIRRNLVEPQARAFKLASSTLRKKALPACNLGGRFNFLLSLSQRGADGNGDWEAYRRCMEDHMFTKESATRMHDDISKELIRNLAREYREAGMKSEGIFFSNLDGGLGDFLLRYLHYVIFGLDPFDESVMGPIRILHYKMASVAYHLDLLGGFLERFVFRKWPEQFREVARIYQESPAISGIEENQPIYNKMTRSELAALMVSIMSLAGMIGPLTLGKILLGQRELCPFQGQATKDIDVTKVWNTLNLDDRDEVKRYIYECGRLRHPVSNTHKVSQEDFTARIGDKMVKFPKGTIIFIPLLLAGLDEKIYGETTYQFDHNRKNLCPFSTMFHSFGEQTNGRICPGKEITETMFIDILIALGKMCRDGYRS